MNAQKTGNFIKELRKEKNWTQEDFGGKLLVTNKTISRWETGEYLPPMDVLEAMGTLFGVTINELLSGQRLADEEYKPHAEENLKATLTSSSFTWKDRLEFFKKKWRKEHRFSAVLIWIPPLAVLAAGFFLKNYISAGTAPILWLIGYGVRHNTMMAYAEDRAFNGRGIES